jgi:uridine kinase
MHRVIDEIKNGKLNVNRPRFNLKSQVVTYEELDLTHVDIILFEGIYVLNTDVPYDFNSYANIKIFIDASKEDIIRWDWQREIDFKNSCCIPVSKSGFNRGVARIMRDYRKNILPKKKKVDFIIEKDANHNYSLIINW